MATCLTAVFPNAIVAVTCSPVFNNINDGQRTMTVMKFGGAVLRNAAGFGCMSSILRGHAAPAVVVVSAFGSSTRMLEVAAETARNGEQELALAMGRSVVAEKQGTCTRDSHRRGNGRNTTGGYCTAPCLFRGMAFTLTQQNLRRQNRIIKAEELPPATVTRQ